MTAPTFEARRAEYRSLWDGVTIQKSRAVGVLATARRIDAHKERYEVVSRETGVPWHVIGIIHAMECDQNFSQHLHNGDPLTAKTVKVPKGRPAGDPPFTWEVSAADALRFDGLDKVADWSIERTCYELEKYNGFGSYEKGVNSAYLWSFTNNYTAGKYVEDHVWSPTAVSEQPGAIALLKALVENGNVTVDKALPAIAAAPWPIAEDRQPSLVAVAAKSKSFWMQVQAFFAAAALMFSETVDGVMSFVSGWLGVIPAAKDEVKSVGDGASQIAGYLKLNASKIVIPLVMATLVIAAYRHIRDKRDMSK